MPPAKAGGANRQLIEEENYWRGDVRVLSANSGKVLVRCHTFNHKCRSSTQCTSWLGVDAGRPLDREFRAAADKLKSPSRCCWQRALALQVRLQMARKWVNDRLDRCRLAPEAPPRTLGVPIGHKVQRLPVVPRLIRGHKQRLPAKSPSRQPTRYWICSHPFPNASWRPRYP
jgi:hypothetical protein